MTQRQDSRLEHPYFMHDAMLGQPAAVADMLSKHAGEAREVGTAIAGKRRVYLVGIGTSWHAALVAEHWFRHFAGPSLEVQAWHSFEFWAYPPELSRDDAVIVISHRGTKTYSFMSLELAKEKGAFTVAITSTDPGPRIQVAEVALTTVPSERSAAFTISYTSALTVLALLAMSVGGQRDSGSEAASALQQIPQTITQVLAGEEAIGQAAQRFHMQRRFICAGWGPNTANTYEVALKMKETSTADGEGLQVEQILHGPFCSVDQECLVTLIAPPGPGYQRAVDVARASGEVGAPVWALVQEGDTDLSKLATEAFSLPAMPELWSPLAYVVPLQLFTYHLALARGFNPDLFQQDNAKQAAARVHYQL